MVLSRGGFTGEKSGKILNDSNDQDEILVINSVVGNRALQLLSGQ